MASEVVLETGLVIEVGEGALSGELQKAWLRAAVRRGAWLIDWAEIVWRDPGLSRQSKALLRPGIPLRLHAKAAGRRWIVFDGEITGAELRVETGRVSWVTQAQGLLHRLNREKLSRRLPEGSLHSQLSLLLQDQAWPVHSPQLMLPAFFQKQRSNWAVIRALAQRLGLVIRLQDGALLLSSAVRESFWQLSPEFRLDSLRVQRPLNPSSLRVSAWEPLSAAAVVSRPSSGSPELREPASLSSSSSAAHKQGSLGVEGNSISGPVLSVSRVAGVDDATFVAQAMGGLRPRGGAQTCLESRSIHPLEPGAVLDTLQLSVVFQGRWRVEELGYDWDERGRRMWARASALETWESGVL